MLIHADVKGLEVVTAAYLSGDKILCEEIKNGIDIHASNQERFKLPDRIIAKILKFRIIYGGTGYSFSRDPDFMNVSRSEDFWNDIITEYYNKYVGIAQWHKQLVDTVLRTGELIMPTGRIFPFNRIDVAKNTAKWRPKILNYPVQGTGADLVAIGRVTLWRRIKHLGLPCLFQSTVHDSIDLDVDNDLDLCYNICSIVEKSIQDIPVNFKRLFGVDFTLPVNCEIGFGPNLGELEKYDAKNHRSKS